MVGLFQFPSNATPIFISRTVMQNLILDAKHDMIQRGELTPSIFPGETDDLDQDQIFLHN